MANLELMAQARNRDERVFQALTEPMRSTELAKLMGLPTKSVRESLKRLSRHGRIQYREGIWSRDPGPMIQAWVCRPRGVA